MTSAALAEAPSSAGVWICLLVVATVVVGWLVVRRLLGPQEVLHAEPPPGWSGRPAPGEIWWADVPFADGTGSKVRPCLVLVTRAGGADVLKVTSQDKSARFDHVPIPTAGWDRKAVHDSWLDVSRAVFVPARAFRPRRAGRVDRATWAVVTGRHPTGWHYASDRA